MRASVKWGQSRLFEKSDLTPLFLGVVLVFLSGCTALQLGYNNADSLLHWRATQYFAFEDEQKTQFERRVQHFLSWHRKTELPKYSQMAEEMATRLSRGVTQDDLVWGYDSFQTHLRESTRVGAKEMGGMLDALAPEQVVRFQERLEKENRDFAKEQGLSEAPERRRELRVKRNIERMEDWFGTLTDAQVERIALYSKRAPLDNKLRLQDRKRMQGELLAMIRKKQARASIEQWAATWDQRRDPTFEAMRQENLREYYSMLLDLDKTLSPEQRSRAVKRLRGFAADFTALVAAAGPR